MLSVSPPKAWPLLKLAVVLLLLPLLWWEAGTPAAATEMLPLFSQPAGHYLEDFLLTLTTPPGVEATILFTLDGRVPEPQTATIYKQPIFLNGRQPNITVVRARLMEPDGTLGTVSNVSYIMGLPTDLPLASLIADPADLWDEEQGIYTNPLERGREWERPIHLTYFDEQGEVGFQEMAGLRIHGNFSRSYSKKSFRLYFRQEYGSRRLFYPLFPDSEQDSFNQLVLHAGGQDSSQIPTNWTMIRNQLMANLAFKTAALATHSQPVLLFINGELWGLYYFRERLDETFLRDVVGVTPAAVLDSPARRAERVGTEEPGLMAWDQLTGFIAEHDPADSDNYPFVQSQINLDNFIDYTILQIYSANFDWPFSNMQQFRPVVTGGKWHWLLWDSDFSLGLVTWSDVTLNTLAQALDPAYTAGTDLATNGRDTILLRSLLQNPAFRARFLARTSELLNTILAPEAVLAEIDTLAHLIQPGIAWEQGRWQSMNDVAEWEAYVEQLRDFARRRPDIVRQQFVESLGLTGMAQMTVATPEAGLEQLVIDQTPVTILPWQGAYLAGSTVLVTAVPAPGYQFIGWNLPTNNQENPLLLTITDDIILQPQFAALTQQQPQAGDVVIESVHPQAEQGAWLALRVERHQGVDLRGWRLTDNDSKVAREEGSLIFMADPALANVPAGTQIIIHLTPSAALDDLNSRDGQMQLWMGSGRLDGASDPWFHLGQHDNLALLAPGDTAVFADDVGIAFKAWGETAVSAHDFIP